MIPVQLYGANMYSYILTVSYYIRTVSCADGPLAPAEREENT